MQLLIFLLLHTVMGIMTTLHLRLHLTNSINRFIIQESAVFCQTHCSCSVLWWTYSQTKNVPTLLQEEREFLLFSTRFPSLDTSVLWTSGSQPFPLHIAYNYNSSFWNVQYDFDETIIQKILFAYFPFFWQCLLTEFTVYTMLCLDLITTILSFIRVSFICTNCGWADGVWLIPRQSAYCLGTDTMRVLNSE